MKWNIPNQGRERSRAERRRQRELPFRVPTPPAKARPAPPAEPPPAKP